MFCDRLRSLRNEHGLTQKGLAEKLGISKSTVAMYETSKRQPDQTTLKQIADFFDVTIDYLVGRFDNKSYVIRDIKNLESNDIIEILDYLADQLKSIPNLTFNNEILEEDDIMNIINAVKIGITITQKKSE